jgi:hypothetical protein
MTGAHEATQLTFLVEHYRPGITPEDFREAASAMRRMTEEMTSFDSPIRFLHSTLVPEDETAFCVFGAPSRTLVEEAYHRAGVPFERIVNALELGQPADD